MSNGDERWRDWVTYLPQFSNILLCSICVFQFHAHHQEFVFVQQQRHIVARLKYNIYIGTGTGWQDPSARSNSKLFRWRRFDLCKWRDRTNNNQWSNHVESDARFARLFTLYVMGYFTTFVMSTVPSSSLPVFWNVIVSPGDIFSMTAHGRTSECENEEKRKRNEIKTAHHPRAHATSR